MLIACNTWEGGRDFLLVKSRKNPITEDTSYIGPISLQGSQERKAGQTNTGEETKTSMVK